MPDSIQIFPPGFRVTDAVGAPVSGAKLKFFDAGTSNPKTVYSDKDLTVALGTVVHCDAGGHPVTTQGGTTRTLIWTGIALYKLQITTSADVDVIPAIDNIKGAVDTAPFAAAAVALPKTPVVAKAADYTVVTADRGTLFNCDPTGGPFTVTLPSAVTVGDNFRVGIRHNGTANQVRIASVSAQAIGLPADVTAVAFALKGRGETVWLVSNGASWSVDTYVPPFMSGTVGVITVASRVSAAPASPAAGARYIVSAAFSTFEAQDIIEWDGISAYIEYTPVADCGWLAFVQDEDAYYSFKGAAWAHLVSTLPLATDTQIGVAEMADQAELEAATSNAVAVTPGRAQYHPGVAKAWVNFNGSGTPAIDRAYNVSSITDTAVGRWTINFTTAFSDANYAPAGMASLSGVIAVIDGDQGGTRTVSACPIRCSESTAGAQQDATDVSVAFFGDQ